MTLRFGEAWGENGPLPADGVLVTSDAEAAAVVARAMYEGRRPPALGLLDGDLARALGARGDRARILSEEATRVPVDLGVVEIRGERSWFVAHLVARRPLWSGRFVAVMNSEYLGRWKLAPRAHPGDGRLDVLEGKLSLNDRLKARDRLPSGEHLPHPGLRTSKVQTVEIDMAGPVTVFLDGRRWRRASRFTVSVEPGALLCVV